MGISLHQDLHLTSKFISPGQPVTRTFCFTAFLL